MNTSWNDAPEAAAAARGDAFAAMSPTRPMYWSVQRELWENRSIYVGPLAVAAVMLFAFLINHMNFPHRMRALSALDPAKQQAAISMPYNVAAGLIIMTAFIVGVFYCLDALRSERRDRSILFWKSLPVSDRTTVLSKASIPLVVLPLLIFPIIVTTQLMMLLLNSAVLLGNGPALAMLWTHVKLLQSSLALLYALAAIALWHAPIYGWLLLVSSWARHATLLWAVLPLLAISAFEAIAFRTSHFASLLRYRAVGWFTQAFVPQVRTNPPLDPLTSLDPVRFLSTPGLWFGLLVAAAFLAAAVRLRRKREPI